MPRIGCYVTLSGDGKTLSFSGDKNDSNMKLVRTIRKDANNSWMEDTNNITIPGNASSTSSAEEDCPRISLSTDGSLLVVGDNGNDNSNTLKKGRVHVYERKELQGANGWQPIDQTIEGEKGEMLGTSVSLSGDGLTLAAGGKDIVQIYRLAADDNMWKIFSTITYATTSLGPKENQESNGTFGSSISLSGDGARIVVGNPENLENGDEGAGIVQVFQLRIDGSWRQLGSPIHGRTIGGRFGFSVALSHDGESLISGGPHRHLSQETGYASVYGDLYVTPSESPSMLTTTSPSDHPSFRPRSDHPSFRPVQNPPTTGQTKIPSPSPSYRPSYRPSKNPTTRQIDIPSSSQSSHPTYRPSQNPTYLPSYRPSLNPITRQTKNPSPVPPLAPNEPDNIVPKAIGGTVGGLTLSLFLLFAFNKRRRRQRNAHEYSPTKSRDLDLTSFPVTLPDSSSVVDTYKRSQSKTFDTFFSHNWGKDSHGRDNHERVKALSKALEQREISSWIDEEQMIGNIDDAIAKGIENSKTAIIFITGDYIAKVAGDGVHCLNDICKKEFQHAMAHIRIANMIPVVMEEDLPAEWKGPVGLALGSSLYYTFKKDEDLDECADTLAVEIASRREDSEEETAAKEVENQYSSGSNSSDKDSDENDDNPANQGQHTDTDPNAEEVDTNGSCRGSMCRESNSLMEESPLKAETSDTLVYRTNTIEKPPKVSFVRFEF